MTQPVSPPPPRPDLKTAPARDAPAGQAPFDVQLQRALAGEQSGGISGTGPDDLQVLRSFQDVRFLAGAVEAPAQQAENARLTGAPDASEAGAARQALPEGVPGGIPGAQPARTPAGSILQPAPEAAVRANALPPRLSSAPASAGVRTAQIASPAGRGSSAVPSAERAPAPSARAPARIQGHFVSLVQAEGGVEVRVRAQGADEDERLRIESDVSAWLAGHGIRIASVRIEGAGNRPEDSMEDGTWTR